MRAPFLAGLILVPSLASGQALAGAAGSTLFPNAVNNGGSVQSVVSYNMVDAIGEMVVFPFDFQTENLASGFANLIDAAYTLPSALIGPDGGTVYNGPCELYIPPGCFTQTELVTLSTPSSYAAPSSVAGKLTATGIGVEIDVSPYALPLKAPRLKCSYSLSQVPGLAPGQFVIAGYETDRPGWAPYDSSVDQTNNSVIALINRFSLFQIMQSEPSNAVGTFKPFPNPLRPALGHLFMTFSLLPPNARVRIYTLTGVLVKDVNADGGGVASWDGTNQAGAKAASGVYFAFVQGEGLTRTFKVAIQR